MICHAISAERIVPEKLNASGFPLHRRLGVSAQTRLAQPTVALTDQTASAAAPVSSAGGFASSSFLVTLSVTSSHRITGYRAAEA